jgi:hypothetical protein
MGNRDVVYSSADSRVRGWRALVAATALALACEQTSASGEAIGVAAQITEEPGDAVAPMVAFFAAPNGECPAGWRPREEWRGRMVLATTNSERVGKLQGPAFNPADLPKHTHGWWATVGFHATDVWLGNGAWLVPTLTSLARGAARGTTTPDDGGYPFLQLALCEQTDSSAIVDELPPFTVAFFNGPTCPRAEDPDRRWEPYEKANGRFIVPLPNAGSQERLVATDWRNGPGTPHDHPGLFSFVKAESIPGDGNECRLFCHGNRAWASSERVPIESYGRPTESPLQHGYVELLACMKTGDRASDKPKVPRYFTYFRAAHDCPNRSRVYASAGRLLVGVPRNGQPYAAYGGPPLMDGENRTHSHDAIKVDFLADDSIPGEYKHVLNTHANGDVPRKVAKHRHYSWVVPLRPESLGLPYIQLAHCIAEPQNPADFPAIDDSNR